MDRYVVLVCNPQSASDARVLGSCRLLAPQLPGWSIAHECPGLLALRRSRGASSGNVYLLREQRGLVVGQLFERREDDYSQARDVHFDASQAAAIVSSGGQYLIDHYWGSYLAVLFEPAGSRYHIIRDPIGTQPCYHLRHSGVDIFFSHLEDVRRLVPLPLQINRRHLAHWLLFSSVKTDETALEGVTHLGRGERLTLSSTGSSRTRVWDPTGFASRDGLEQPEAASRALRSSVQNAVDAWTSRYQRIAHRVSGGLDSAIIAGCLAQAPTSPEVIYQHLTVDTKLLPQHHYLAGVDAQTAVKLRALAGNGDERYYAQLIAKRWHKTMIEQSRDLAMDLTRLRQVPLGVAPSMYYTAMEMDDAALELIASHGTQAFFSGQAGDSVLLATVQPLPSIDYAYDRGLARGLWEQILATTALSKDSVWSVIGKSVKHGLLRRPYVGPMRLVDRPTLLTSEHMSTLGEHDLESSFARLAREARLSPGKRNHVSGVASGFYNFVFEAGDYADHIDPLNSQPVWEAMLQIPSYTALLGGVSRGLARHAFSDLLPPEIRKRQTKGTGNLFYQQLVRRNRAFLREHLEGGQLVQQGFLDRHRLTECLRSEEPSVTIPAAILMSYLAAELWLQQVTNGASASVRAQQETALRAVSV